jgi:hypothetical protein
VVFARALLKRFGSFVNFARCCLEESRLRQRMFGKNVPMSYRFG